MRDLGDVVNESENNKYKQTKSMSTTLISLMILNRLDKKQLKKHMSRTNEFLVRVTRNLLETHC